MPAGERQVSTYISLAGRIFSFYIHATAPHNINVDLRTRFRVTDLGTLDLGTLVR